MSRAPHPVVRYAFTDAWWLGLMLLCVPAPAALGDPAQEVVDAARFAYGLETGYWEHPEDFSTRDKLYQYYRQGFSAELAAAMTAHTLSGDPDLATWVPQQVHVAKIDDGRALVWFPTPAALGATWGLEDYTVLRLRRDGDRWVVYEGRDQSAPPAL